MNEHIEQAIETWISTNCVDYTTKEFGDGYFFTANCIPDLLATLRSATPERMGPPDTAVQTTHSVLTWGNPPCPRCGRVDWFWMSKARTNGFTTRAFSDSVAVRSCCESEQSLMLPVPSIQSVPTVEEIRPLVQDWWDGYDLTVDSDVDELTLRLHKLLLSRHPQPRTEEVREWIPVTERLPEEANLSVKPHNMAWLIYTGIWIKVTHVHPANWNHPDDFTGKITDPVTHWQPLPAPPKEKV